MADVLMTVVAGTKAGMLDLAGNAATETGDACAAADQFYFPNDGNTVIVIHAVTGDTWTFDPIADKYGRTEVLADAVAAGDIAILGPFLPELWNDAAGCCWFTPGLWNVGDLLLAMSFNTPS